MNNDIVSRSDYKGDLHMHTTYSDGLDGLKDMAASALEMGYRYIAITDHAATANVASHTEKSLLAQKREIEALNDELLGKLTILQGVELDIGRSGNLPDLGGLVHEVDVVIASLHTHFDLGEIQMTERVVKALSHPFVKILGHPTARRGRTRPPVRMDLESVFLAAAENGVALEINSTPTRLDLREDHILLAMQHHCVFSINTDSHSAAGLPRVTLGLELAQNAQVSKREIVNCLELNELTAWLNQR